ncbi:hypothetical protein PFHG_04047 [Plasmodium falciparum HB3]|uniref:Uncharacterized protein n=1 Tax=Plasmodium falciparum (isolate HB3) TaxID=137071 RepID=A0A0L7KG62_PLAFX|nr:hypothetical protein PFHG_04047 [Plasmodium falciparum HB3]
MFALSRYFLLSFEIPFNQIQKITARSSGPGGQKTSSQISNYKICADKLKHILEEAEIKKYKDNLINQKKKRQQRKFNKRDYD